MLLFLAILLGCGASLLSCMGLFGIDSNSQKSEVTDNKVSLNAGGFGASNSNITGSTITYGDAEVAKKALDVAKEQSSVALESTYYTLAALQAFQTRALGSVDSAVTAAQSIAGQAAPISPGNYAEAVSGQTSKTIVILAAVIGAVIIFAGNKK